jgi:HK97 family phage major capsid protein
MNLYKQQAHAALERRSALVNDLKAVEADTSLSDSERRSKAEAIAAGIAQAEAEARTAVEAGEREAEVRVLSASSSLPGAFGSRQTREDVPFRSGDSFASLAGRTATPEDFGDYVRSVYRGETRTNVEGTQSAGGFLVPKEYSASVLDLTRNKARVIQAGAQVVPMSSSELQMAKVDGDPSAAWRNESAAIATGDLTFGAVQFKAKSLAVLVKASRELVEDASNFGQVLQTALADSFAVKLDAAALYGTGVSPEPLGIKATSGVTKAPIGANGGPAAWAPLASGVQAIRAANFEPTAMILSERSESALSSIAGSDGHYVAPPLYIADIARYATSQVPNNLTVGSSNDTSDIFIGDFTYAHLGVRTEFQLQVLRERFADTGEVGFVAWVRADVQVSRPAAFHVVTGVK